jgi:hypothetical protein
MKLRTPRWLLIGLFFLTAGIAHAQTACPPGMTPYGVGVCGYDNSQQPSAQQQAQPPQKQWKDHWGAIAIALPKGVLGVSNNFPSERQATQVALADCQSKGGTTCKLESTYGNTCAAMIVGHPGYAIATGSSEGEAIQKGMKMCTDGGDTNCHAYYSACSLPQRIQ